MAQGVLPTLLEIKKINTAKWGRSRICKEKKHAYYFYIYNFTHNILSQKESDTRRMKPFTKLYYAKLQLGSNQNTTQGGKHGRRQTS